MKYSLFLFSLAWFFAAGCSKKGEEQAGAASAEKSSESRVKLGTNDTVMITIEPETQKTIGLEVAELKPVQAPPSMKCYGRVLDATQFATQFSELAAAAATSEASQKELQRLKSLAEQNNASQKVLQAAEAMAARDQAQVQAARLRLVGVWGPSLVNRPDLPALIQSLSSFSNSLVQLAVPAAAALASPPSVARVFSSLATNVTPTEAEFVGIASTVDPQMQGQQFIFLVRSNSLNFISGTPVTGYLGLPGQPKSGVLLPRGSLVRFNGATWAYRQISDKTFERVEVQLLEPLADGWFSGPALKEGEKVVVTSAQLLLSEELKGQIGE